MRRHRSRLAVIIPVFILTIIAAFLLVMFIKTGKIGFGDNAIVLQQGTIFYDDSLSSEEQTALKAVFDKTSVAKDVTISVKDLAEKSTAENTLVYDILVPVADFYYPSNDLSTAGANSDGASEQAREERSSSPAASTAPSGASATDNFISIRKLTPDKKLLSLDGYYFFDDYAHGAKFHTLFFSGDNPKEARDILAPEINSLPDSETTLSFAQTGTTAISRAMLLKLAAVGGDGAYFAENIKTFLASKDLTHISNEVSFADNCPGGTNTTTLCSDWRALDSLKAIGTDIVELTGNHNNDYGHQAYLNTVAKYEELNWKTFGGGKDEETAKIPLELNEKGAKITLIGVNQSSSTKSNGEGASGNNPGANIYDEDTVKSQITTAKSANNFVIVDVQFSECYCYPDGYTEMPSCDAPISGQEAFFKHLIDLGADMVIGTQAHQPQTYELYQGKPIYYGLGNLFFDQTYWPGTTRGIILTHYFVNAQHIQTRFTPTVYDQSLQVKLMDESAAEAFITRLNNAR